MGWCQPFLPGYGVADEVRGWGGQPDPYFKTIRTCTCLGTMLDHFPGLFPTWYYTDLRQRFIARFG